MRHCEACGTETPGDAEGVLCVDCLSEIGLSADVARRTELQPPTPSEEQTGPRLTGISHALRAASPEPDR